MKKLAEYRTWAIKKIRKAKNPAGVRTSSLTEGRTIKKRLGLLPRECDELLTELRNRGVLAYTNGHWWVRNEAAP